MKKGIDGSKIVAMGIPINRKFATKMSSKDRTLLGIETKQLLVMSGSMGYGDVVENIMRLDRMDMDFQIISVCGNNKSLKTQIDDLEIRRKYITCGL